jgi:hypothetical protein
MVPPSFVTLAMQIAWASSDFLVVLDAHETLIGDRDTGGARRAS